MKHCYCCCCCCFKIGSKRTLRLIKSYSIGKIHIIPMNSQEYEGVMKFCRAKFPTTIQVGLNSLVFLVDSYGQVKMSYCKHPNLSFPHPLPTLKSPGLY